MVRKTSFLLQKSATSPGESQSSRVDGEGGDAVAELAVLPVEEGREHVLVRDRSAHVVKSVGDTLEAAREGGDREVSLDEVEEVTLDEHGPLKTIVAEEVGDDGPSVGGGVGGLDA